MSTPSQSRANAPLQPLRDSRPLGYLSRALCAASWPLLGIWYFLRHPDYYPLFYGRLLPLSLISFLVYVALFTFAFVPQYLFLAIFHGWGAWVNAIVLVLGEGLVIVQALFEGFFVDESRVDVFDATLIDHGLTDLVAPHRLLFPDASSSVKMLGKPISRAAYSPWSLIQIIELIVCLPLNFIPYVGVPAYLLITGSRLGRLSHHRWFKLRGLDKKTRKQEIRSRGWDYLWFGTVAMILELVPVLSLFFLLTTTAGSALWVCSLESGRAQGGHQADSAAGQLSVERPDYEIADQVPNEPPPPYHDEPV